MGRRTEANTYSIYMHEFPNGKKYIGQTCVDPGIRWRGGKRYSGFMRKAIDKYGWDNIKHTIIMTGLDADAADKVERELIAEYRTNDPQYGYNITEGGDGYRGATHSEETRALLRQKANEQWQRQKAEGYVPPPITEKHREHLKKSHMGHTPWNKGKHTMTDDMKRQLKTAREQYWQDVKNGNRENPNRR